MHDDVVADRNGEAMVGTGFLCHHKSGARDYAMTVARECLTRYNGFSGYVLHPPEFVTGCLCESCRVTYRERTGGKLEPIVAGLIPGGRAFTLSIPWIFESGFDKVADLIPSHHTIIEWDYNQAPERIATLADRIRE